MSRIRRFMFKLRTFLGNYPKLFFGLYGLKKRNRDLFIKPNTELVVSAYPRTANTFFIVALEHIQKREIKIAHHLHVPALAMRGIKRNIPTVVLVRKPEDAISSLLIREQHISIDLAIKAYIQFHKPLLKNLNRVLIVDFSRITEDFPSIIDEINRKFGMQLENYSDLEPLDNDVIFQKIEAINKRFNKNQLVETMVSRPSELRDDLKSEISAKLRSDKHSDDLDLCNSIYRKLCKTNDNALQASV